MSLHPHTRIPHGREVSECRRKKSREKGRSREATAYVSKRERGRERQRIFVYGNNNIPHAKDLLGPNLGLTVVHTRLRRVSEIAPKLRPSGINPVIQIPIPTVVHRHQPSFLQTTCLPIS